jgi:hypothetical protein
VHSVSTTLAASFATNFTSVVDTGGKFATGVNDICRQCQRHLWQIATGINDTSSKFAAGVNWQTMGTISGCRYLKVNLKAKMCLKVISSSQRCPNKIIKTFMTEDFFHLPLVSTTPMVHLELRISVHIFEKNLKRP